MKLQIILKQQGSNWRTIGIAPEIGLTMKRFPVDETHIFGKEWGEDSALFCEKVKHILIKVGGGYQAQHEAKTLREKGVEFFEHNLPIKKELLEQWDKKENSIFTKK